MLLSDRDIRAEIEWGRVVLDPIDLDDVLQPSSVDIKLDNQFCWYKPDTVVDVRQDQTLNMTSFVAEGCFTMAPHEFVLGSSAEHITLPDDIAARFEGKSSIGRLGLAPHVAAGFIDPGFSGYITLELHNVTAQSMKIVPGMKIGQLCFFKLSSPSDVPYGSSSLGSKYQGQRGPTVSKYYMNFDQR